MGSAAVGVAGLIGLIIFVVFCEGGYAEEQNLTRDDFVSGLPHCCRSILPVCQLGLVQYNKFSWQRIHHIPMVMVEQIEHSLSIPYPFGVGKI